MRNGSAPRKRPDAIAGDVVRATNAAAQATTDRREHERVVTVFRLAKLIGDREEFCLVRNVSEGGLKVQVFSPKSIGDRIAVDFGDERALAARVAWVEEDHIGLSFEDQIDVGRALSKAPAPGRSRARPIRLAIELEAIATIAKTPEPCRIRDISQGGAKLAMASAPPPGEEMTLEIEGLGKLQCVVRWTRDGQVGVAFPGQLPYRRLAAWVGGAKPQHWTATVYPGPKGNVVFNASTIFWSQGLSSPPGHMLPWSHWSRPHGPDERVQRITQNVLKRALGGG